MIINNLTRKEKGFVIFGYLIYMITTLIFSFITIYVHCWGYVDQQECTEQSLFQFMSFKLFGHDGLAIPFLIFFNLLFWGFVIIYNKVVKEKVNSSLE